VIDPIDGSLNAKRGLRHHALSIAVADGPTMADVRFGYVFDFGPEEEWWASSGSGAFLDGERIDAPAGTFVFAAPGVMRTAFAAEPDTTVLAIGGRPGEAWEPDGWELWTPVAPLFDDGRYAEAADLSRQLVDANPGLPMLPYMLACCELKAGRTDEAIEALRAALVTKRMRVIAAKDANLDPLRDIPAFRELLNPS